MVESGLNKTDWRENSKYKILLLAFKLYMIWALSVSQTQSEPFSLTPAVPSVWNTVPPNLCLGIPFVSSSLCFSASSLALA